MIKKQKLISLISLITISSFHLPVMAMDSLTINSSSNTYNNSLLNPVNLLTELCESKTFVDYDYNKLQFKLIDKNAILSSSEKELRMEKKAILIKARQYLEAYGPEENLEPIKIPENCSYSETMDYIILNYNRTDNKEFNEFSMACILYRLAEHIKVPVVFITNYFKHVNIEIFWDQRNNDICCGKKIRFFVIPNKNNQTNKSWDSLDIVQIMIPEKLKNLSYSKIYEMYSDWRSDSNLNLFDVLGNILNISNVPSATSSSLSLSHSPDKKYTVKNLNKMLGFDN